jgi:hypothetical protein
MPSVLEGLINVMKTLVDDDPKPPMHIGEAMSCWTYMATLDEAIVYEHAALNSTTDQELRNALNDAIRMCESQVKVLKVLMLNEGVPLPPASAPKPKCEPSDIPLGVKVTDDEIANAISLKVAAALIACATEAAQAIRNDVAIMWVRFQMEQITYGATLKTMMRKRGWIKLPPPYCPPGSPHRS